MAVSSPPGVVPERYSGGVILQDSPKSLAVSAVLQASEYFASDIVQMYMYAFDKERNCPGDVVCNVSSHFFEPGTRTPLAGNVLRLLGTSVKASATQELHVSSFNLFPLTATMTSSLGYEMHVCFVRRGNTWGASAATAYERLYGSSTAACTNTAVFPARTSFD